MDKIDIHHSEKNYNEALELLKKDVSKKNYILIKEYLDASAIGKAAQKNARRKQVGIRARLKNLYLLKVAVKFFKKDLNTLKEADMEQFIKALNENSIKKNDGRSYSEQTKANIKKTLIIFLRYTLKDSVLFAKMTDWIETSYKKKEIPALTESEIKTILSKCITSHQKALVAVLFDSGARIEEFMNIRLGDLTLVAGELPYYKVLIREEFSKTAGRNIGLFWKPTTEIIKQYLEEHPERNNLSAPFFPSSYDGIRALLHKLGKRALGKTINPHLFRHSSATYYAGNGTDYFQLCRRYGWRIGSNMPHNYIDRSGINEKEMKEKFIDTNIKDLNEELARIKRERAIEREQMLAGLKEALDQIKILDGEMNRLKHKKGAT